MAEDIQDPPKSRFQGREIVHGSIAETISIDARRHGLLPPSGFRRYFNDVMEKYDPGGRRAHEIAKKYYSKSE
jgi:hypothetical protein